MNLNRLYALLFAWLVCLIAPSVILQSGLFGPVGLNTDIPGAAIGLWIGGYLAQFAVFMWISSIAGQRVLGWICASLLPWALDWTLPASPLFALLWIPIAIAVAVWIAATARSDALLRRNGIRAAGVVLEVFKPWMNVIVNGVYIKRKVRLRIERADKVPPYEGVLNGLFMIGNIPSVGDRIALLVDPANPQRFEYDDDPSPEPAAKARTADTSGGGKNIADELEKLSDLHDRSAISDDEFEAAKKKLLGLS